MWKCLAEGPNAPEDIDELLRFLFSLLLYQDGTTATVKCLIAKEGILCVLDECFPSLDPNLLTPHGYTCLQIYMLKVGGSNNTLILPRVVWQVAECLR